MVALKDVKPDMMIGKIAEELKNMEQIKPHKYSGFVKSGVNAERPPTQPDFWYLRSAAILRRVYLNGPVGTQRLRTVFGGKKNRGHKPEHFFRGSGSVVRKILQQLESVDLVKKKKKGRVISPKGQKLLDNAAHKLVK